MIMTLPRRSFLAGLLAAPVAAAVGCSRKSNANELLNASYDPTRELYGELNAAFSKTAKGRGLAFKQSHGGSGKQARAVIDGLKADVVTLALAYDIDALVKAKLVKDDWKSRLPNDACPFRSTIVLLVRKGNPKGIADFADLAKAGVDVITPNPKTSGGARWNYLAAWGSELARTHDEAKAKELVRGIFKNVPVLDSGARGATTTFVERKIGDVLIAWENEALLATKELAKGELEIVVPPSSILAEPPVAVVDKVVDERGTRSAAEAYLSFLWEEEAQAIAAKHYYRPTKQETLEANASTFGKIELFTIGEQFGSWADAQEKHFADGGTFDDIYQPK
jgi:sulfate/thiosulfate-binding protein